MDDINLEHRQGQLVYMPDRRGKVLFVKEGENPLSITKKSTGPAWMCNFYKLELNITVSFWLRCVIEGPVKAGTANIVDIVPCMSIKYDAQNGKMIVSIALG